MKDYIVKISAYDGECFIQFGTGIIIGKNLILTAKHVVYGKEYVVEINGVAEKAEIVRSNDVASVLEIKTEYSKYLANIFSVDECLDKESEWQVSGFITSEQILHNMLGKGFAFDKNDTMGYNYVLVSISVGIADNYSGLSGSPVLCDSRIVGILQSQDMSYSNNVNIYMSSVEMFIELLPENCLQRNKFKDLLYEKCIEYSAQQIAKNVSSRKYIPQIFVEEGNYKEKIRYFADPVLFLKKSIRELKFLHDAFRGFDENFVVKETEEIAERLLKQVEGVICEMKAKRYNNSMEFFLDDIKKNLEYIGYKYILITKNAGQGKTNFLCDFTENFLMRKKYFVLYFNAYEFINDPMTYIEEYLSINGGYSTSYAKKVLSKEWDNNRKPMVVLIDGLNENYTIDHFGMVVKDFLEKCEKYPYIKVIMTTRNELLQERFGVIPDGVYINKYKHMDMFIRADDFKQRIFEGYLDFFRISIRNATLRNSTYETLTDNLLLLRFFCEVNADKDKIYMYDVHIYDLFDKYMQKKSEEYCIDKSLNRNKAFQAILDKLSKHMLDKNEFFKITLSIFDNNEEELLAKMVENEVILKDEVEVKTGFLKQKEISISFTFDEFRDFCITNYILKQSEDQNSFMVFWNKITENSTPIKEGVLKYVFYLSKTKYKDELLYIVESVPEYEELYWKYIWQVEDKYISEIDIGKLKDQLRFNGSYSQNVVEYLVLKYDCIYSEHVNIKILFQILDEFAGSMDKYEAFIKKMFYSYSKKRRYGYEVEQNAVLDIKNIVECLSKYGTEHHIELYRLTIYLYELNIAGVMEVWEMLYKNHPKTAIHILKDMNKHSRSIIQGNVKDILGFLEKSKRKDKFDKDIENLIKENKFCYDTPIVKFFGGFI